MPRLSILSFTSQGMLYNFLCEQSACLFRSGEPYLGPVHPTVRIRTFLENLLKLYLDLHHPNSMFQEVPFLYGITGDKV